MESRRSTANQLPEHCPAYQGSVELIGRRWSGAILLAMLGGSERFSEIQSQVPGLSDRLLAERLKEFALEGVVRREVGDDQPVSIRYTLTDKGKALAPAVEALLHWAQEWGTTAAD